MTSKKSAALTALRNVPGRQRLEFQIMKQQYDRLRANGQNLDAREVARLATERMHALKAEADELAAMVKVNGWNAQMLAGAPKADEETRKGIDRLINSNTDPGRIAQMLVKRQDLGGMKYLLDQMWSVIPDEKRRAEVERSISLQALPILGPEQQSALLELKEVDANHGASVAYNHSQAVKFFEYASEHEYNLPTPTSFNDWAHLDASEPYWQTPDSQASWTYPNGSSQLPLETGA